MTWSIEFLEEAQKDMKKLDDYRCFCQNWWTSLQRSSKKKRETWFIIERMEKPLSGKFPDSGFFVEKYMSEEIA